MMSLWDALRMNMMISYQELVRTFPSSMWFATIYPASLVGSMTCAMMLSEPCF